MGIRGLGGFIKWKLPHIRKSLKWATHAGARWGIDCSCLLYRARGANLSPTTVIASLLVRLRRFEIEPIFIFDGRPPVVKTDVIEQRRTARAAAHKEMAELKVDLERDSLTMTEKSDLERRHAALQKKAPTVTGNDRDEVKTLLYAAGVQFITASGEADDVLSYLCRDHTIQAVVSTDMDMLARGVPLVITPETADATVLTEIRLADVLTGLCLQYPQFVDACMLMGSDYSDKDWKPVEPKEAVALAQKGVSGTATGAALLMGTGVIWEDIVSENQRDKWARGPPACEPATLITLATRSGWPADWAAVLSNRL